MIRALGNFFTKIAKKWIPDAFIFAIILTILVFVLGMVIQGTSFINMTSYWGGGMWSLLGFSMQMVLVLVTGSALAMSKPVHKVLKAIATAANTPVKAVAIVAFVMGIGCWLNWGFGLIISAILAKEIAKVTKGIHYPLLVASSYSGFVLWHSGLSASIQLSIAGKNSVMDKFAEGAIVPVSETIFSPQTLIIAIVLLVTIPIINILMMPKKKEEIVEIDPSIFAEDEKDEGPVKSRKDMTPAEKTENSIVLAVIVGVVGLIFADPLSREGRFPQPGHRQLHLPGPGPYLPRDPDQLREGRGQVRTDLRRHRAAVPVLRGHHGHDGQAPAWPPPSPTGSSPFPRPRPSSSSPTIPRASSTCSCRPAAASGPSRDRS